MRKHLLSILVILALTAATPALADAPERTLRDVIIESIADCSRSAGRDRGVLRSCLRERIIAFVRDRAAGRSQVPTEASAVSAPTSDTESVIVARVIDGDTVELEDGRKLRYIGIDAPESVHPTVDEECFGKEASARNKQLVEGRMLQLEKDVSETDRYGRLLRYVFMDGEMINERLVREGYANASSYPPDVKYQVQLNAAEREARERGIGLWGGCAIEPEVAELPGQCQYACGGPDRDCKDFRTHEEAQGFFECCGFSAENDPMRLDGRTGGDGVACESLAN